MRRRRLFILLLIAALLIAAAAVLLTLGPDEPTVKGIPLRRWMVLTGFADLEKGVAQVGPEAIPWLIRGLETEESRFHRFKLAAWKKLPRNLRIKWSKFHPLDPSMLRRQCAYGLKWFGTEATSAVPQLIRAAGDTNEQFIASISLQALAEMAADSQDAMGALLGFLKQTDYPLHPQIATAFWNAELKPKEALPFFLSQLQNYDPASNGTKPLNEMLAISHYGADGAAAGPLLIRYLTLGEGRGNALTALNGIGPGAAPAVPALLDLLASADSPQHKVAVAQVKPLTFRIFANLGPAARAALPVLTNGLHDANGVVRALAAAAIANVTGDHDFAVPPLVKELENRRWRTEDRSLTMYLGLHGGIGLNQRHTAALLLGEIGPKATNALPNLAACLKSSDGWLPVLAADAIWKIAGDAKTILPCLTEAATHTDAYRRALALRTLRTMGPAAEPAIPAIRAATKIDMKTRHAAVEALKHINAPKATLAGTASR